MRVPARMWAARLNKMDLTFRCSRCGYEIEGSYTNNKTACPSCDDGMLVATERTILAVHDAYGLLLKQMMENANVYKAGGNSELHAIQRAAES